MAFKEAGPATYTDGTPVQQGDSIRYHQAPGGLLPHGDWDYGTAEFYPPQQAKPYDWQDPDAPLLRGYELATAETTAQIVRLARRHSASICSSNLRRLASSVMPSTRCRGRRNTEREPAHEGVAERRRVLGTSGSARSASCARSCRRSWSRSGSRSARRERTRGPTGRTSASSTRRTTGWWRTS